MIVLKHLAKEFNTTAFRLRTLLRKSNFNHQGRWQWAKDDKELKRVRAYLARSLNKRLTVTLSQSTRSSSDV